MIKTILAWITGKSDTKAAEAPYKVEAPAIAPEVAAQLQKAHDAVVASGQPDDSKGLDEAIAAQVSQPVVETAPVTVKAKYKRADLNKMTKKDLLALVAQHGVEVKARATKEEIVKVLVKV